MGKGRSRLKIIGPSTWIKIGKFLAQRREHSDFNKRSNSMKKLNVADFTIVKELGEGAFGKVKLVRSKNDPDSVYAMKIMSKDHLLAKETNSKQSVKTERNILASLDHPFVTKLYHAFQTNENLYFIMEYIRGGELYDYLDERMESNTSLNESQIRLYAAELIIGLEHLHSEGIIYRDLKPDNILIRNDGHLCLADFGLSKKMSKKDEELRAMSFAGSPLYVAPEIVSQDRYNPKGYGKSCDLWSLGVILYVMATLDFPFYQDEALAVMNDIITKPVILPEDTNISEELRSLILGLLEKDPDKRLTTQQIKNHDFFSGLDWDKVISKEYTPEYIPSQTATPIKTRKLSQQDRSGVSRASRSFSGFTYPPPKGRDEGGDEENQQDKKSSTRSKKNR